MTLSVSVRFICFERPLLFLPLTFPTLGPTSNQQSSITEILIGNTYLQSCIVLHMQVLLKCCYLKSKFLPFIFVVNKTSTFVCSILPVEFWCSPNIVLFYFISLHWDNCYHLEAIVVYWCSTNSTHFDLFIKWPIFE